MFPICVLYALFCLASGCLFRSSSIFVFVIESLSEINVFAVMCKFLMSILVFKVDRFPSCCKLHSLVHIGAPNISLSALFCITSSFAYCASFKFTSVGAL